LHDLTSTKGKTDFLNAIEVKTSTFPFSENLNLLVRPDYAAARSPKVYVQNIINTSDREHEKLFQAPLVEYPVGQRIKRFYLHPLKTLGANLVVMAVILVTILKL